MDSDITKLIDDVVNLFMDAEVTSVPLYEEIRDELEIRTDRHVYEAMIARVEHKLALLLHKKFPCNFAKSNFNMFDAEVTVRWFKRGFSQDDLFDGLEYKEITK